MRAGRPQFPRPRPTLVTRRLQLDVRHAAPSRRCRRIAGNVLLHMFVPGTEFIVIALVLEYVGQVPRDEEHFREHEGGVAGTVCTRVTALARSGSRPRGRTAGRRPSGSAAGPRSGRIWHEHSLRTPSSHRRGVTSERAGGMSRPAVILTGPIAHGPDRLRSARLLAAVLGEID